MKPMEPRTGARSPARVEAVGGGAPVNLELEEGRVYVLGRGSGVDLRVDEEPFLSRRHAELWLESGRLKGRRLPEARNPLIVGGSKTDEFTLDGGQNFVVGNTTFHFTAPTAPAELGPSETVVVEKQELYKLDSASERNLLLDLLELPEKLRSKSEDEFFQHIASLLRQAVGATWVRVADSAGKPLAEDPPAPKGATRRWSRSLVEAALMDSPRPTLFRWTGTPPAFKTTALTGVDWAICAAATVPGERSLVLYTSGNGHAPPVGSWEANTRLVGLVADTVGRCLSVRRLETWKGRLQHYFSGPVASRIIDGDSRDLEPRKANSTVLFFDIRGFSKRTEDSNEKILDYLGELRRAMTAMTEEIFKEHGVVLQYQGDGILACWNVPIADPRHVDRACRAALAMKAALPKVTDGWTCGIGLHTGELVAGTMGSDQIFSYNLMGAVVNQASRIEGITKVLEVPILVSREVAERVSKDAAGAVRIGRFRPAEMNRALDLYELLPVPLDEERSAILSQGLAAFENGDWERSYQIFEQLSAKDRPARYLKTLAEQYRRHPPKDWQGVIELDVK